VLACALALTVSKSAFALGVSQCDFSNVDDLVLNGFADQSGSLLALTDSDFSESGSAYYATAIPWTGATSFHTTFQFQIDPVSGTDAEGLSFILQGSSDGSAALGGTSYKLGYSAIAPSLEVEFDTHQDSWDPNANHVGIMTDGDYKTHLATGTPAFTMAGGGVLFAWIDYDATSAELDVYLSQTADKPASPLVMYDTALDIAGSSVFVGFTSSTSSTIGSEQDILSWEFSTDGTMCSCNGNAECPSSTECMASETDAGDSLCVAIVDGGMSETPDAGPPLGDSGPVDASYEAGKRLDAGESVDASPPKHPDSGAPHDASVPKKPVDAGKTSKPPTKDAGHPVHKDAGKGGGGSLAGGACAYAPGDPGVNGAGALLLVVAVIAAARRRSGRA
jgi:hypothetical protein